MAIDTDMIELKLVRKSGEVVLALEPLQGLWTEEQYLHNHDPRNQEAFWLGADLVVEIVSPDNPTRDTVKKRAEYAAAGIPEYWIVDPQLDTIMVLRLEDGRYTEHGVFRRGMTATSALLVGFEVGVV